MKSFDTRSFRKADEASRAQVQSWERVGRFEDRAATFLTIRHGRGNDACG